jgi:single-stranded-DNA-specific exonuclease
MDGEGWHRGVIGILASRIVDLTGKPALVLAHEGGEAYGSGRSIEGFHLLEALEHCAHLFTRFGGHAHAVGFSLPSDRVGLLRDAMVRYAAVHIREEDLGQPLGCHAELPLELVTPALYKWLRMLEPMGMGNEEPVFIARALRLAAPPRYMKEKHVRLQIEGAGGAGFSALGWHWGERVRALDLREGDALDLAYKLRENEHPEYGGLELEIADLHLLR